MQLLNQIRNAITYRPFGGTSKFSRCKKQQKFCGLGFIYPKHESNCAVAFRSSAAMGLADFHFTVGVPYVRAYADVIESSKIVPTFSFKSIEELLFERKPLHCQTVAVELTADAVPLEEFKWPDRVIIVMGNERDGIPKNRLKSFDHVVKLPSIGASMNVSAAASVVLYDRYLKGFQKGIS